MLLTEKNLVFASKNVKILYLECNEVGDLYLPCISTNFTNWLGEILFFMVRRYNGVPFVTCDDSVVGFLVRIFST